VPDVVTTAQAGQASVANCNLIRDKQIESAFVQSNVAFNAYNGVDQFKEKPAKNLRFIASLYPETIQIVARADSGIKTVKDIKGKRLVPVTAAAEPRSTRSTSSAFTATPTRTSPVSTGSASPERPSGSRTSRPT